MKTNLVVLLLAGLMLVAPAGANNFAALQQVHERMPAAFVTVNPGCL